MYDSTEDTQKHIARVRELLSSAQDALYSRGLRHDLSKLEDPEKSAFDKLTPLLKTCTYGSDEYNGYLKDLKDVLQHHYINNSHHPEHYKNGIDGMNLFDIIEMFFDWKAAGERHNDGNIFKSIEISTDRFKMSNQLVNIFINTADYLKYGFRWNYVEFGVSGDNGQNIDFIVYYKFKDKEFSHRLVLVDYTCYCDAPGLTKHYLQKDFSFFLENGKPNGFNNDLFYLGENEILDSNDKRTLVEIARKTWVESGREFLNNELVYNGA